MSRKSSAIQSTIDTAIADNQTGNHTAENNGADSPEKQSRIRRYSANVYLDASDPNEFYLIVAAGTVVYAIFSFEPATCKATNKSASRMMLAAARGLLKDKASLVKLATCRLEQTDVTPGCKFHPDNFGEVYSALAAAFVAFMPKADVATA